MILSLFYLSFLLGMRHGLDPDHLAIINGSNINQKSEGKVNPWNGFFFSLGHGCTVTLIGIAVLTLSHTMSTYSFVFQYTEWIPIILLLFTGIYGLYNLTHQTSDKHTHKKLLHVIGRKSNPSIQLFITGLLFALVFDTSTQVAAWGLIGETKDQYTNAIMIGFLFTAGMMCTDTINGFLFSKVLKTEYASINLNKILSLMVVLSSLSIGCIELFGKMGYHIEISDHVKIWWGGILMMITILSVSLPWLTKRLFLTK